MCACSHVSTLSQTKDETAACHAPRVIAACYWYAARQHLAADNPEGCGAGQNRVWVVGSLQ